jgi:hypothetical protein
VKAVKEIIKGPSSLRVSKLWWFGGGEGIRRGSLQREEGIT